MSAITNTKLQVLNLYAGIGGNRKNWTNVNVTAVELDAKVADVYQRLYPDDTVIIGDAKDYLLHHYDKFDFIWLSPPCQTHSRMRQFMNVNQGRCKPIYPDYGLYEMITLLQHNRHKPWIVENVKPYYNPLIKPDFSLGRHHFWSNVPVPYKSFPLEGAVGRPAVVKTLSIEYGIDVAALADINKPTALKNCVTPDIGAYILDFVRQQQNPTRIDCTATTDRYTQTSFINSLGELQC